MLRGRNWKAVALQQTQTHFARGKGGMDQQRMEALSKVWRAGKWSGAGRRGEGEVHLRLR